MLQLAGLAVALRLALALVPLPRLTAWVATRSTGWLGHLPIGHRGHGVERLATLADLGAWAAPRGGRCVVRSVLLLWTLRARGMPAALVLGVNREGGVLGAHAWVESGGRILGDRPDTGERFAALLRA